MELFWWTWIVLLLLSSCWHLSDRILSSDISYKQHIPVVSISFFRKIWCIWIYYNSFTSTYIAFLCFICLVAQEFWDHASYVFPSRLSFLSVALLYFFNVFNLFTPAYSNQDMGHAFVMPLSSPVFYWNNLRFWF